MTEWLAFERVEGPIGMERADMHAAIIAAVIANANRGQGDKAVEPEEFMRWWEPEDDVDEFPTWAGPAATEVG